ncbi:MAG TPA: hypothetical protein VLB29_13430 [Nocardioidaceae bacterium]|nr:hypothetical protein [Nocardioidaceae bacterium]
MTTHSKQDDRAENYRRIADPATYRDQGPGERPQGEVPRQDETTAVPFPAVRDGQRPVAHFDDTARNPEDDAEYAEVRQRERFGGINWGAGFFGWLVVAGMAAVLTGVASAVVMVLDETLDVIPPQAQSDPRAMAIVVAAVVLTIVMLAYFAGGYVAGRMSRFDGGRQGAAVWVTGLLLATLSVGVGLVLGSQYGVLDRVPLPSLPVPSETVGIAAAAGAVVALLGSLLAAIGGGKVGCRYHSKVDAFGYDGYVDD